MKTTSCSPRAARPPLPILARVHRHRHRLRHYRRHSPTPTFAISVSTHRSPLVVPASLSPPSHLRVNPRVSMVIRGWASSKTALYAGVTGRVCRLLLPRDSRCLVR